MTKIKKISNLTFIAIIVLLILSFYGNACNQKEKSDVQDKISINDKEDVIDKQVNFLYDSLEAEKYNLDPLALKYALIGYYSLLSEDKIKNERYISIIDFNQSSDKKRFYTIDLDSIKIIYHTYVAHGRNTGMKKSLKFSDVHQSKQSSIGFYITGKTYIGSKGFSMRLHGDEIGYNKNMYDRAIVMHTANYVSDDYLSRNGRLGRSWGCPVLQKCIYKEVINTIKDGSMIFAYFNDEQYLHVSKYLKNRKIIPLAERYIP